VGIFTRLFALVVITTILTSFLLVGSASAISNPDSIAIEKLKVFTNIWEKGDWLVFVEYDIDYLVTPPEDPEDTYLVALYNELGNLVASNPLNYYGHNIISIYLNSSNVTTKGLDWDLIDNYSIRVTGNPVYFFPLVEDTNFDTRFFDSSTDAFDNNSDYNRQLLGALCVTVAEILEKDWGIDLLTDNDRLNSAGSITFKDAIPGLDQVCPSIFAEALSIAEVPALTKVVYLYPNADSGTTIASQNPAINSHYDKVNWPVNIEFVRGTVDSGSTTAIVCSDFNQGDDFWNSATLEVIKTSDGQAPQGELAIVLDFVGSEDKFKLNTALSATVEAGDQFRLDYSDTYIYTSSTSIQGDSYELDGFTFIDNSDVVGITVFFTLSNTGSGTAYARPYISLSSFETVGSWRSCSVRTIKASETLDRPGGHTWSTTDIADLEVGIDIYCSGTSQASISSLYVGLTYTVPDWSMAYDEDLRNNMGNRLTNAMNGFGDWLGIPGTIAASVGMFIIYCLVAGRIYVATGSTQSAIALTIPFLLLGSYLGMIPLYVIFAAGFLVIILFGITFILGRFA